MMKKTISLFTAILLLLSLSISACASDLDVSMANSNQQANPMDFSNIQMGNVYEVPGYASFLPESFAFYDYFAQYQRGKAGDHEQDSCYVNSTHVSRDGKNEWRSYYKNAYWNDSGANAEFAWLVLDITNLQKSEMLYLGEITVKVVYDNEYEYAGWVRQFNKDYTTPVYRKGQAEKAFYAMNGDFQQGLIALDPEDEQPIGMVYTGKYAIGCTLPNAVVESKRPLKMIINIGGCELTYIIRK